MGKGLDSDRANQVRRGGKGLVVGSQSHIPVNYLLIGVMAHKKVEDHCSNAMLPKPTSLEAVAQTPLRGREGEDMMQFQGS